MPKLDGIRRLWAELALVAALLAVVATLLEILNVVGLPWGITIVCVASAVVTIRFAVKEGKAREAAEARFAAIQGGDGEAAELRRQLEVATRNANHEVIEEQIMTLEVADPGAGPDRQMFDYSTRAVGTESCLWRRISYSSGDSAPTQEGFRVSVRSGNGTLIGLSADSTTWTGVFFFDTPIRPGDEPRDWALVVEWPGLADPLRKRGDDILIFRSQIPHDLLTIRVTIPLSWKWIPREFQRVVPPGTGTQTRRDEGPRAVLEWRVEKPETGREYAAYFRASVS